MGKKTIRLTEADIEKLVQKVLSEQTELENANQKTLTLPNFNNLFKIGEYRDVDGKIKQAVEGQKPKIINFMKENPENPDFVAEIMAGESQITNPKGFEEKGSLALARAKTVSEIINEVMSELISDGYFVVVEPTIDKVKIGSTKYDRTEFANACGSRKEKMDSTECQNYLKPYNIEQFVTIKVTGKGESMICNTELKINGSKMPAPNFEYIHPKDLGVNIDMTGIKFKGFTIPDRPIIISDSGKRAVPPFFTRETVSRNPAEERRYYLELAMLRFLYPGSPAFEGVETVILYQENKDMPRFNRYLQRKAKDNKDRDGSSVLGKQFIKIAESVGGDQNAEISKVIDEIKNNDFHLGQEIFRNNFENLFKPMWGQCPKIKTQSASVFRVNREMTKTVRVGSFAPLDKTIFSITPVCS